ncbi:ATP-binding protein [Foetidibacter luteolus]|uniref:ATP-binding protein n=1 Tax=Foetidibacter luteolus TaxID=2608880 RepID=UPI00129BFC6A|nr:tetratricopeptide repeat-containing sensor histidine kinase [Foetidibacter luteolus]
MFLKAFCRVGVLLAMFCCMAGNALPQKKLSDYIYDSAKQLLASSAYDSAIVLFARSGVAAQKEHNALNTGNSFIGIGIANDRSGNYEVALQNYFTALKWYESINNKNKMAGTLKNIGNIYRVLRTYDKSQSFLQQALSLFNSIKDSTGASNVLNDMGLLNMATGSNHKAIANFKVILQQYGKYVKDEVRPFVLNNLGYTQVKVGDYEGAAISYRDAMKLFRQRNDQYGVGLVYGGIADMYVLQRMHAQAVDNANRSLAIAEQIKSKELQSMAYKSLADAYGSMADYEKANQYLQLHANLKDTLFKEESARKYAEMESKYQNEKKQKEISLLQKENIIKNSQLTNQKLTRNFLLLGLLLIVIIAASLYRGYRFKQRANKELNELNNQLDKANQSKTKLLGIISHDLRTPVSSLVTLLNLQRSNPQRFTKEEKEKYDNQIAESANNTLEAMEDILIWSKSQMESFVPFNETIYLYDFFDSVIHIHSTAAAAKNISLLNNCPGDLSLTTDPNFLKIILRNLVSNAVKFTPQNGTIQLSALKQNNTVHVYVKDNGPGIDEKHLATIFEWNSIRSDTSGLGLRLAKEFTEKLDGVIIVHSQLGEGTEFELKFEDRGS